MDFCFWLRLYRLKAKLSQKRLAEILGVSRQTVNYWESGKVSPKLTFNQWVDLCKLLGYDFVDSLTK
jgi:DNA-binding XRE family transcriptional regulator